ncbi:MAG: sulfite exporter TauE/SafE family protein [Pseudomonadota bacterium]
MELLSLSVADAAWLAAIAFVAGIVRGFTGFALSAVVMVVAVLILPPVELIPMLWWLEMVASLLMVRAGWREADRRLALGLVVGSGIGLPLGLWLTLSLSAESSALIALSLIAALALAQLLRLRLAFLDTRPGLLGAGLAAGVTTGLSAAGGMVVALYVLVIDRTARVVRASLVLYLFTALCVGFFTHVAVGTMDAEAVARGLAFAIPTALGVVLGKALFIPKYEPFYKPVCLILLISVAGIGIARDLLT